jgi:hypothetical protein
MSHTGVNDAYEVVLGPAAIRTVLSLPGPGERKELADALRTELTNGPNAHNELRFDDAVRTYSDRGAGPGKAVYTATPLSFAGYTAIHRHLTREELKRMRREQGRSTARRGLYLIDILRAESAFTRTVPRLV